MDYQVNVIDQARDKANPGSNWTDKVAGIGREFWAK